MPNKTKSPKYYTLNQVLDRLHSEIADRNDDNGVGGQGRLATEIGIAQSSLSNMLKYRIPPSKRVLDWLRMVGLLVYVDKGE